MTSKTLHGFVLKSHDGLQQSDDCLWGLATVEMPDSDGDIIRVKGLSLEKHTTQSPIKILAQHLKVLPNGEPPIIGIVDQFKTIDYRSKADDATKPALAFRMKFADTDLAKSYQKLMRDGMVTDFSIGARVKKADKIKNAGYDITESMLCEISAVTIGANYSANVLRAIKDEFGEAIESNDLSEDEDVVDDDSDVIDALAKALENNTVGIAEVIKRQDSLQDQVERLADLVESSEVVKSKAVDQATDNQDDRKDEATELLRKLMSHISSL